MNNILDDIASNLNFYIPYFKQFKLHLRGNKIGVLDSPSSKAKEYFNRNNIEVSALENVDNLKVLNNLDGIIINNYQTDDLIKLFSNIYNCLKESGIMLLIYNNSKYDKDSINFHIKGYFDIIEELIGDDRWNFILYSKKTTK